MQEAGKSILIAAEEMRQVFNRILRNHGFDSDKAERTAQIFTQNSIDGVYTHGVNRFPVFIDYVAKGFVIPGAEPLHRSSTGVIEQWDGQLGPGPLNAERATARAMELAHQSGLGCVAMSNTNHWMRGGTYGWQAAKKGFVFIGFSNTKANMPAWSAVDKRVGNNPLVIAIPYQEEAIVLDMAMSQFSFGALEHAAMKYEALVVDGGYDKEGKLTKDPNAIIESGRLLPMGHWKGAGLALLLDILAALLSGGMPTHKIDRQDGEYGLSQVFIAIDLFKLSNQSSMQQVIRGIISDYQESVPIHSGQKLRYPGERVLKTRAQNLAAGIPVVSGVWQKILALG